MSDLARLVGTPLSPVLVSITNQYPAPAVRPSGDLTIEQQQALDRLQHPWSNADGSTNVAAVAWTGVSLLSVAISAIHGARRNNGSFWWGAAWGVAGGIAPIIVPAIAYAQGFGKPIR